MNLDVPQFPNAVCATVGTDVFYADEADRVHNAEAKAICAVCPDRLPCATWAIDSREPFGIWGGLTARERHEARRGRPRTARDVAVRAVRTTRRDSVVISAGRSEQARLMHAAGHTNAAIARRLDVHERTVGRYLKETS